MDIEIINALEEPEEVRALFKEYTDYLCENDPVFKSYLELQNYDDELSDLSVKYGGQHGRLYLARRGGRSLGCIGIKDFGGGVCELKRLYVRPEARGARLGERLVELVLNEAADMGYEYMKLDTLPFLEAAKHIYLKAGFYEIEKYLASPMENSTYLCYDLKQRKK